MASAVLEELRERLRTAPPMMSRKQVYFASGEHLAVATQATYDCLGKGIPGKRLVGKRVCYPKNEVFKYLAAYMGENAEDVAEV